MIALSTFRKVNIVAFNGLWYGIWTLAGFKVDGWWLYLGLSPVWAYAIWHLIFTPIGAAERKLVGYTLILSFLWEGVWRSLDVLEYREGGIPLWIVAMWVNFALSLCHSWWPWIRTPISGLLLGLAAGLLPYLAAEKMGCVHVKHREILLVTWIIHASILTKLLRATMKGVFLK